jgi:uncharacterized protein GlcG (DUF336 family)
MSRGSFSGIFQTAALCCAPKKVRLEMFKMQQRVGLFLCLMILVASAALAQTAPPAYGMSIGVENAKKVASAAIAEARKNMLTMAIAVVDTAGNLVYFEKMDGTQTGSVNVAIEKARSAVLFKRSTKAFQDVVAQGGVGLRILGLPGAVPVDGGTPLTEAGKIIGAIGVSGGTSDQDGQCAQAGASVLK